MHFIEFHFNKAEMLCFNCDTLDAQIFLNGKRIPVVSRDRHLCSFNSTAMLDRNMINYVSDFYQRSYWIINDFRSCNYAALDDLHRNLNVWWSEFCRTTDWR